MSRLDTCHRARHVAHSWPTKSCNHPAGSRPPGVRTQLPTVRRSRTQRDPARTSRRTVTCGNTPPKGAVSDAQSPPPPSAGRAGRRPLTCPDLARNWPADTVNGPRNRSRAHIRPGPQTGLTCSYAWQVLGSNQRRRMPAILQGAHCHPSEWPLTCYFSNPRRVKTAFRPRGVRNSRVCLVSAMQVLDHVPRGPAESCCVPFSRCHPAIPGAGRARH